MKLSQLLPGQTGTVSQVEGSKSFIRRLISLGITTGQQVLMVRQAPLGDPLEVAVGRLHLALRRNEAELVSLCV